MSQKATEVLVRQFGMGKKDAERKCASLKPEEVAELEGRWVEPPANVTKAAATKPAEEPASDDG